MVRHRADNHKDKGLNHVAQVLRRFVCCRRAAATELNGKEYAFSKFMTLASSRIINVLMLGGLCWCPHLTQYSPQWA